MWIKRHWRAIGGTALTLLGCVQTVVGWAGDIDFVLEKWRTPGLAGNVLTTILNPPAWASLLVLGAGITFIFWDIRSGRDKRFKAVLLLRRRDDVVTKCDDWTAILEKVKTDFAAGSVSKEQGELIVKEIEKQRRDLILIWADQLFEYACSFSTDNDKSAAWTLKHTVVQHDDMLNHSWVSVKHSQEIATLEMTKTVIVRVIDRCLSQTAMGFWPARLSK